MNTDYETGYRNGIRGIPAPAPGWGTAKRRDAYINGWRAGRAVAKAGTEESSDVL